jgi:RNA ligase (TIGR02306 family)
VSIRGMTANEGDDMATRMGITKYVNPQEARLEQHQASNEARARARAVAKGPKLPVYGLDPLRKYSECLPEGELVVVSEKIHGCNARFVLNKGRLWVGSHRVMRGCSRSRFQEAWDKVKLWALTLFGQKHRAHTLRDMGDVWWQTAEKYNLKARLQGLDDMVLYGEIYGQTANGASIQSGKEDGKKFAFCYDAKNEVGFRAFDVYDLKAQRFLDFNEFEEFLMRLNDAAPGPAINPVPILEIGPWSKQMEAQYRTFADEGKTPFANANGHLGEGVVIKPFRERIDPRCGRVALKFAGARYLLSQDE